MVSLNFCGAWSIPLTLAPALPISLPHMSVIDQAGPYPLGRDGAGWMKNLRRDPPGVESEDDSIGVLIMRLGHKEVDGGLNDIDASAGLAPTIRLDVKAHL